MEITEDVLEQKINDGEALIVDFWAPWCGPCRMMKPTFEKVAAEVNESEAGVKMYTLNVEENRNLAAKLGIRAIPTVKGFNGGQESFTKSGVLPEGVIREYATTIING